MLVFIISGGLSSTSSKVFKSFAIRPKLGGCILCPKVISTSSNMQYSTSLNHVFTFHYHIIFKYAKVDRCLEINFQNSTNLQTVITVSIQLKIEQKYHQKKRNFSSLDEEDWSITHLGICESRSMSRNELQKLNLYSNAHNTTSTTRNQTKLPQKRWNFKNFQTICSSKEYDLCWLQNAQKHIVLLGLGFRWKLLWKGS